MTRTILLNCVEPFLPAIDITMGDEVPVYSRASLSRTAVTVVALLLTATAGAVAREFRAADTQSESHAGAIDFNRTNVALPGTFAPAMNVPAMSFLNRVRPVRSIADIGGFRLFVRQPELMSDMIRALGAGVAMAGIYAKAQRDPAAAPLIERIREVE
jgi:hypothetical protein